MNERNFVPVSLVAGLAAGALAGKLFDFVWGRIADEEAPDPEHRDVSLVKLAFALVLEGAIVRLVRGMVDHGSRREWARRTGVWPGEAKQESV